MNSAPEDTTELQAAAIMLPPAELEAWVREAVTAQIDAVNHNNYTRLPNYFAAPIVERIARVDKAADNYPGTPGADVPITGETITVTFKSATNLHAKYRIEVWLPAGHPHAGLLWRNTWTAAVDPPTSAPACPNCGAPARAADRACRYCSHTLGVNTGAHIVAVSTS